MIHDLPELLSATELAKQAGVHPNTIRRQCREGTIPSVKLGQKVLIPRDLVFRKFIEMEEQLGQ